MGGGTDGGVAVVHKQLLTSLFQNDSKVKVAGVVATNARSRAVDTPKLTEFFFPPVKGIEEKNWYLNLLETLKPDCVVFFHIANRWAKFHIESSVPMVGAIHSWHQVTQATSEKRSEKYRDLLTSLLPRCSSLVVPSEYTKAEGRSLGFSYSCPVQVAHNPLADAFYDSNYLDAPCRDEQSLVGVGSLIKRKRLDFVVRAAGEIGLNVTIVGSGDEKLALEKLAIDCGIANRASFYERLKQHEIADLHRRMGVYCGPSTSESFGNVYIEALACGLPVVGFKGTLDEISLKMGMSVGVGVDGDASFDEFLAALETVLATSWNRAELTRRVREVFSIEQTVADYLIAIEKAVS